MDLIRKVSLLVLTVLAFSAFDANATLMSFGNFASSGGRGAVTGLNGFWSLTFDNNAVTGIGSENFYNVALDSISLIPNPLGATTFDISNTVARLHFNDGDLTQIVIGGIFSGGAAVMRVNTDDFSAEYRYGILRNLRWTIASEPNAYVTPIARSGGYTLSLSSDVPNPATLALFSLGLAGLGWSRRKSDKIKPA